MKLEMTSYKNSGGDTVTLYKNNAGYMATIVCDQVTLYNPNGDMICGAPNDDAAIQLLKQWSE